MERPRKKRKVRKRRRGKKRKINLKEYGVG